MGPDGRDSVTSGRGVIVLPVTNAYGFAEHSTVAAAKAEAHRLCERVGGKFVVYAPVAIIEPAPRTIETPIMPDAIQQSAFRDPDDFGF